MATQSNDSTLDTATIQNIGTRLRGQALDTGHFEYETHEGPRTARLIAIPP